MIPVPTICGLEIRVDTSHKANHEIHTVKIFKIDESSLVIRTIMHSDIY